MVLTPQEQSLLGEARKWAMEHWNPHSDAWETARQFPREAYAQAAADGYLGLASSKQYGGRDLDALSCALIYEGLSYGDPSLTTYLHIFNSLVSQLEKWYHPAPEVLALIPDFVAGRKFMAFALSELDAGSDPAAGKAWCTEDGGDYVVTGDKAWVSNSHHDDYFMLIVHGPGDGMTMMLADRSTPGLTVDQDPERIAGCAISCGQLHLRGCRIPKRNTLCENGLSAALRAIDTARLNASVTAVGLAQRAVDLSAAYLAGRETFGKPVLSNQAIRFRLAEMQTEIEAQQAYQPTTAGEDGRIPTADAGSQAFLFDEAAAEDLMHVLEHVNCRSCGNQEILSIILDEADTFFSGQKTAQEAARVMDRRAALFLAEAG